MEAQDAKGQENRDSRHLCHGFLVSYNSMVCMQALASDLLTFINRVCAISIVRQYIQFTGNNNVDPARSLLPREIWLSIESNVAIICGCLPVLTPLFRKLSVLSRFLPSTIRSKITGPSAMEQASWPSVLRGPRRDVEQGPGEKVVRTPWRAAPWREPDSSSEESASPCVQETYHHHDMPSQPELGQIHRVGVAF